MEEAPPAAASAATAAGSEVSLNQTIYINNLNEKIKLDGIISFLLDVLFLTSLRAVFGELIFGYG